MTTKEKVLSAIESLDEKATLYDVIDRLCLVRKIELGIAQADDLILPHDDNGEGSFEAPQGADRSPHGFVRLGKEVENNFAVNGGLKDGPTGLEFVAQGCGIDEISVVGDSKLTSGCVDAEGLGIEQGA